MNDEAKRQAVTKALREDKAGTALALAGFRYFQAGGTGSRLEDLRKTG